MKQHEHNIPFVHLAGLMQVEVQGVGTAQLQVFSHGEAWIDAGDPLPAGTYVENMKFGNYRFVLNNATVSTR